MKKLQEKKKADGAVERGCGLTDRMAGREGEQPPSFQQQEEPVVPSGGRDVANYFLRGPCPRPDSLMPRALRRTPARCPASWIHAVLEAGGGPSWCSWQGASQAPPHSKGWPRGQHCQLYRSDGDLDNSSCCSTAVLGANLTDRVRIAWACL